jgi:uncharacterized membrane protein
MPDFSSTGRILGLLAVAVVAATYLLVAMRWRSIEGKVPCHFDPFGRPDGWSGKSFLWFFPTFAAVFVAALAFLSAYVVRRGEPVKSAEGLAAYGALIATCMLILAVRSLAIAQKRAANLGKLFLPCLLIGLALISWHYFL